MKNNYTEELSNYINEFKDLKQHYNQSFIRFISNKTLNEKENIIRFFSKNYPEYKFTLSQQKTAVIFKKRDI